MKKCKSLIKKKVFLIINEILLGSASIKSSSTMGLNNPGAGFLYSSSTALLTSIAVLITSKYISKLKIRYTKPRDWRNVKTIVWKDFEAING